MMDLGQDVIKQGIYGNCEIWNFNPQSTIHCSSTHTKSIIDRVDHCYSALIPF